MINFITQGNFFEALTDFTYPQKRFGLLVIEFPISNAQHIFVFL